MGLIETIHSLCDAVDILSNVVREQADIIEQHNLLDEEESQQMKGRIRAALEWNEEGGG